MIEKPTPPGDYDCCESGCEPCVWDVYQSELAEWRSAETKLEEKNREGNGQKIPKDKTNDPCL